MKYRMEIIPPVPGERPMRLFSDVYFNLEDVIKAYPKSHTIRIFELTESLKFERPGEVEKPKEEKEWLNPTVPTSILDFSGLWRTSKNYFVYITHFDGTNWIGHRWHPEIAGWIVNETFEFSLGGVNTGLGVLLNRKRSVEDKNFEGIPEFKLKEERTESEVT